MRKLKFKYFGRTVLFFLVAGLNVITVMNNERSLDFSTTSLLAISESGINEKRYGYVDDPKECEISEVVHCTIGGIVNLPYVGPVNCSIDIPYTLTVKGTANYCIYTGNENMWCNYFTCRRNG